LVHTDESVVEGRAAAHTTEQEAVLTVVSVAHHERQVANASASAIVAAGVRDGVVAESLVDQVFL
jgi:hypothetical protein